MVKSIESDIKISLCEEHRRRIKIIDSEDYSGVMRKMREQFPHMKQVELEEGIFALKQYYATALFDPSNGHAVSAEVDPFWHAHMLFSHQYDSFCKRVVGEMMHHQPMDKSDKKQLKKGVRLYRYTLQILGKVFKTVGDKMWAKKEIKSHLICMHFGNSRTYEDIQPIRIFEPMGYTFEVGQDRRYY